MIEALFLIIWSALFLAIAYISWVKIERHFKIYLLMVYNWVYLTGIFFIYPKLRPAVEYLYGYFA